MKAKITDGNIRSFPEGAEVWDVLMPNLTLRVGKNSRTWTVRSSAGGKRRKLGRFPSLGIADARQAARDTLLRLEGGGTPEPILLELAEEEGPQNGTTIGELLALFETRTREKQMLLPRKQQRGLKSLGRKMQILERELADLVDLPVDQLTKQHLRAIRDRIADAGHPVASNLFLDHLSPVLAWAAREDIILANLCPAIERRAPHTIERTRVLTDDEVRAIWHSSRGSNLASTAAFQRCLHFMFATAQRLEECAGLTWAQVEGHLWRQTSNKSNREHLVPLTPLALDPMGPSGEGLVFQGRDGSLNSFSFFKRQINKASGVRDWRFHDVRRTVATRMPKLGIDERIVGRVLNHAPEGVTARHYNHHGYLDEKRHALQVWADHLQELVA